MYLKLKLIAMCNIHYFFGNFVELIIKGLRGVVSTRMSYLIVSVLGYLLIPSGGILDTYTWWKRHMCYDRVACAGRECRWYMSISTRLEEPVCTTLWWNLLQVPGMRNTNFVMNWIYYILIVYFCKWWVMLIYEK